jgi:hypothetical protein
MCGWGRNPGRLVLRPVTAVIGSRLGAWCIRKMTPLDHKLLSRSNGRLTVFGPLGVPWLLPTTTGRKTRAGKRARLQKVCRLAQNDGTYEAGQRAIYEFSS